MNLHVFAVLFSTKFVPFFFALAGFGLLITIHEFGHFLFCKLFGIHTPTFSIGMGPTIYRRKIGDTNFRLAAIPIGGYVEIAGMAEVGQGEQVQAHEMGPRSFSSKPYWQKFFVLTGGILFNMLFAYSVFIALYFIGMPVREKIDLIIKKPGISQVWAVGDKIISVNNQLLKQDPKELFPALARISKKISENPKKDVKIRVQRGGKKLDITIPWEDNGTQLDIGLFAGATLDVKTIKLTYERYPFFQSIKKGINHTHMWVRTTFYSLKMLVAKRNTKAFGGPIRILSKSFEMAQQGLQLLFVFLAIISINLAVINILPIGALDGGQLLFETIEVIIRRKIPNIIRFSINLASWILILGLILLLSYQDIIALFVS